MGAGLHLCSVASGEKWGCSCSPPNPCLNVFLKSVLSPALSLVPPTLYIILSLRVPISEDNPVQPAVGLKAFVALILSSWVGDGIRPAPFFTS